MNIYVSFILFFASALNISAQNKTKQFFDSKNDLSNKEITLVRNIVTDKLFDNNKHDDEGDLKTLDENAIIERPCPVFDRFCIRKFFAEHAKCKIVPGPIIEPFYVTEAELYLVNSNITATATNSMLTGLNGRIEEFYVNRATGNVVLSIYFDGVKAEASPVYLRFDRKGEEQVEITASSALVDYSQMSITIVIPNVNNLILDQSEIIGYLDNPVPPFIILPSSLKNIDPTVAEDVISILADIPTAAIENLPTIAPLVGKIFVQKNICDFGVPINRN